MRITDEIQEEITFRFAVGLFVGFAVMMVATDMASYFEIQIEQSSVWITWIGFCLCVMVLGPQVGRVALAIFPLYCLVAGINMSVLEIQSIGSNTDLNGDGVFSISDFITMVFRVIFATSSVWVDQSNISSAETFLGIPLWVVLVPVKIFLTLFYWGIFVFSIGYGVLTPWSSGETDKDVDNNPD